MSDHDEDAKRKAYNAAYHAAKREQILQHKRDTYYAKLEEKRSLARERMARSRANDPEKFRQISRLASKKWKAAKAIAEGREPGRVGNPKRQTPEERRAYLDRWREANADKLRAQDATRKLRYTREKAAREGRTLHKHGRAPIFTKEQRIERARARSLAYWANNPGKRKELYRRYYEENIEAVMVNSRNRRARKKKAAGKHSAADIAYLFKLQKGKCVFCLKPLIQTKFHIDHHTPLSKGGSNDRSNLRLLHNKCNLSKGARDPAEHALRNGLLCW